MISSPVLSCLVLAGVFLGSCSYFLSVLYQTANHIFLDPYENFANFPIDLDNATAVFNTVSGALKQKNSNLLPNGVSFFPAYIPPGTLMYHATDKPSIPDSYEWIAFNLEFSYIFGGFIRENSDLHEKAPPPEHPQHAFTANPPTDHRYLYTFRNTKALDKVIYLDGASAAKTRTGTMDQQHVLSGLGDEGIQYRDEWIMAEKICKWGQSFGLQGVIRLEIGFEMILCNFFDNIELVGNMTMSNVTEMVGFPSETWESESDLAKLRSSLLDDIGATRSYEWALAGSQVNDGEPKILLDYSNLVTPLNRTYISPNPYTRRIINLPDKQKNSIIQRLEDALARGVNPLFKNDWQNRILAFEDKFGPILLSINNTLAAFEKDLISTNTSFAIQTGLRELTRLTYNVVRMHYNDVGSDDALKRKSSFKSAVRDYVYHTHPVQTELDVLIYSSFFKVVTEVLGAIYDTFYETRALLPDYYVSPTLDHNEQHRESLLELQLRFADLLNVIRWPIFTACTKKCGHDEFCYVPTWGPGPFGFQTRDEKYFNYDGHIYTIPNELQCVSYKDCKKRRS